MLEQLVKQDHDLRKIDKHFNFTYDLHEPYYSEDKGLPSIDPVVLLKMSLIQALDDIRSEEKLVDAIFHAKHKERTYSRISSRIGPFFDDLKVAQCETLLSTKCSYLLGGN